MLDAAFPVPSKEDCRLQAIMAMFRGQRASDVSVTFRISRSDLYKFWHRALTAVRRALEVKRKVVDRLCGLRGSGSIFTERLIETGTWWMCASATPATSHTAAGAEEPIRMRWRSS